MSSVFTTSSSPLDVEWPDAPGAVFFLARGGLRRLSRSKDAFLGYAPDDLFWRDMLEMVHEEDLLTLNAAIWRVKQTPGNCQWVEARLRDASGDWRTVEVTVQNVLEAPGDGGLVMAGVRELAEAGHVSGGGARLEPW